MTADGAREWKNPNLGLGEGDVRIWEDGRGRQCEVVDGALAGVGGWRRGGDVAAIVNPEEDGSRG